MPFPGSPPRLLVSVSPTARYAVSPFTHPMPIPPPEWRKAHQGGVPAAPGTNPRRVRDPPRAVSPPPKPKGGHERGGACNVSHRTGRAAGWRCPRLRSCAQGANRRFAVAGWVRRLHDARAQRRSFDCRQHPGTGLTADPAQWMNGHLGRRSQPRYDHGLAIADTLYGSIVVHEHAVCVDTDRRMTHERRGVKIMARMTSTGEGR